MRTNRKARANSDHSPWCNNDHPTQSVCCWCGSGHMYDLPAVLTKRTGIFHPCCPMCLRHTFGYQGDWKASRVRTLLARLTGTGNTQERLTA